MEQEQELKNVVKCTDAVAKRCQYGMSISGGGWACDYIGWNNKRRPCHYSQCTEFTRKSKRRTNKIDFS